MNTDPIANAARLLREAAEELKICHTLEATGHDWTGEPEAKAAYDEHMATADALELWASSVGAGGVEPLRRRECLHQISEPIRWPKDAKEVREFFSSDFIRAEFVQDGHEPCDEDRYYISAHDFLSAVEWWADFPHEPSGWQPIDTAPKDGTTVLVYPPTWAGRTCATASYDKNSYAAKPRPYWERHDALGKVCYSREKPPTHWMPLPAPPSSAEEGGSNGAI